MRATRINHVSVHAVDLEESVRFYTEVFGMEKIPTPRFAFPVQWLRLGDQQLHLFVREDGEGRPYHHVGIDVDDFEAVYRRAQELGIHDSAAFFEELYELPDGAVQMYLRDPAGNLIEIDWPDVTTLDRDAIPKITRLADTVEQTGDAVRATLYHQRGDAA
jgi:lactoylglutathione lyase